ncbi:MAG: hypothetical protein O7C56_04120 [Rickettsia endosymbiont of Ixodes persulcatus]|nr:hypothetical protein [Rickettsia endosymbiont of Ixodes persulcatus]
MRSGEKAVAVLDARNIILLGNTYARLSTGISTLAEISFMLGVNITKKRTGSAGTRKMLDLESL